MKKPFLTGISFGLTSGVITTLGLMIGLSSSTHSRLAVIGGVLTIAIADAFSDALGIHVSEESNKAESKADIWEATLTTLLAKFIIAASFLLPVLLLPLNRAVTVSIIWGAALIILLSLYISRKRKERPWQVVGEHVGIGIVVITLSYLVGRWINGNFS